MKSGEGSQTRIENHSGKSTTTYLPFQNPLLIILFLLSIKAYTCDNIHIRPNQNGAGVIFQPLSNFKLTTARWTLITSLNITSLTKDLTSIEEAFHQEKHLIKNITTQTQYGRVKAIVDAAMTTIQTEFQHFRFRLKGEIIPISEAKKVKRSLFPSIGYTLNFLAGTATNDDVGKVQQQVNELYEKQDKLISLQEKQLTAFRLLDHQVNHQQAALAKQVNLSLALFATLKDYIQQHKLTDQPTLHLIWQRDMLATLTLFRTTIINFKRILDVLQSGYLPPDLLPPETLLEALRHIQQQLPAHMHLAIPLTDAGILQYYRLNLAAALPHETEIRGQLYRPLGDAEDEFQLFTAIPFPHMEPNTTARFILDQPAQLVAISTDRSRFLQPGPQFTTHQCIPTNPLICPATLMLNNDLHSDNCLFQIFTGRLGSHQSSKTCHFTTYHSQGVDLATITDQLWAFSSPREVILESKCLNT